MRASPVDLAFPAPWARDCRKVPFGRPLQLLQMNGLQLAPETDAPLLLDPIQRVNFVLRCARSELEPPPQSREVQETPKVTGIMWVWVKIKPPGDQVLVHVSTYQGSIWGTYF